MRHTDRTIVAAAASRTPAIQFGVLGVVMLATPLLLFAIGWARDSVFLIDGSGALFGTDVVLLLWMRDLNKRGNK